MRNLPGHVLIYLMLLTCPAGAFAQPGQIPQIPAFLPMMTAVPATAAQPIDGIWTISSLGKRVRIEGGRAYAVDPWVHMFVLQIQPGMVVIKDIRSAGHGSFTGSDLPLMGAWNASIGVSGVLDVQVAAMIPVRYQLLPMQLDNPTWFQQTVAGASVPTGDRQQPGVVPVAAPGQPAPAPEPGLVPPPPAETYPSEPPTDAAPEAPPSQAVSCREVVYREESDDFACVQ